MPRKARKLLYAEYHHVMVQGIKKEYVFQNNEFKSMYLRILNKYLEEAEIKLVAYCIMGNHAHLLLKLNDINILSKCMHFVNTTFAKNYNEELNRVGYVFRNRFASEPIYDSNYLLNCIKYIHMNPVKALICNKQAEYTFSSYNYFIQEKNNILQELYIDERTYNDLISDNIKVGDFIEECLDFEDSKKWLDKYLENNHFTLEYIMNNEGILKDVIVTLKECCKTQNVVIEKIFGINKWKLRRLLNLK